MSTHELEQKARELRQLQALIEEAQAEAEGIKDQIKAAMGDSEAVQAGEYKNHLPHGKDRQSRHQRPQTGVPGRGRAVYQRDGQQTVQHCIRKARYPTPVKARTAGRKRTPRGS